eukprot:m.162222 g.162222  ORF g.162222 m.162222 type:complete len:101 (-) comp14371_c0_seq1:13-315(-)
MGILFLPAYDHVLLVQTTASLPATTVRTLNEFKHHDTHTHTKFPVLDISVRRHPYAPFMCTCERPFPMHDAMNDKGNQIQFLMFVVRGFCNMPKINACRS